VDLQEITRKFSSDDHSWLVLSTDLGKMTVDDLDRVPAHAAQEEKTKRYNQTNLADCR